MLQNELNRRDFVKKAGLGAAAAIGTSAFSPLAASAVESVGPLMITKVESVTFKNAHWTWVRIHTDRGIVGTGETYPLSGAQVGALDDLANLIIGRDARDIERIWQDMYFRAAFNVSGGAEMRIISAVNIALYDIVGQASGLPVYQLIGGKARDSVRVYQTSRGEIKNGWTNEKDIEKIVQFLYDSGIKCIKIWPYDPIGRRNDGSYISNDDLEEGLAWIKRIRNTLGDSMEIAIEFHSYWNLPCAIKIAKSLEPYNIMWIEDMLMQDNMESYSVLARESNIPVLVSERLATRFQYRELMEEKGCDIAMWDVTWCGGITEAKKISDFADTYFIPTVPHTHGGPILWLASIHVSMALTNLWNMESTYNHYTFQFRDFIESYPVPIDGFVKAADEPGLGLHIVNGLLESDNAIVKVAAEV
jgi:galactonate dehydratase